METQTYLHYPSRNIRKEHFFVLFALSRTEDLLEILMLKHSACLITKGTQQRLMKNWLSRGACRVHHCELNDASILNPKAISNKWSAARFDDWNFDWLSTKRAQSPLVYDLFKFSQSGWFECVNSGISLYERLKKLTKNRQFSAQIGPLIIRYLHDISTNFLRHLEGEN